MVPELSTEIVPLLTLVLIRNASLPEEISLASARLIRLRLPVVNEPDGVDAARSWR